MLRFESSLPYSHHMSVATTNKKPKFLAGKYNSCSGAGLSRSSWPRAAWPNLLLPCTFFCVQFLLGPLSSTFWGAQNHFWGVPLNHHEDATVKDSHKHTLQWRSPEGACKRKKCLQDAGRSMAMWRAKGLSFPFFLHSLQWTPDGHVCFAPVGRFVFSKIFAGFRAVQLDFVKSKAGFGLHQVPAPRLFAPAPGSRPGGRAEAPASALALAGAPPGAVQELWEGWLKLQKASQQL